MKIFETKTAPNPRRVRMFMAEKGLLDQAEFIAAQFQDIQDQRAVVKAEGNPQGRNQDYLEQRKNLDSLENINRELNQS